MSQKRYCICREAAGLNYFSLCNPMNKKSSPPDSSYFNKQTLKFLSVLKPLKDNNAYLVGGTVRDVLRGKQPYDIDIVVSGDAESFSKRLARETSGILFSLDKNRGVFRVISKIEPASLHYDISPMRGGSIYSDLLLRDFTVDAIAIPLFDLNTIIDPYDGEGDIKRRLIRVLSEKSFEDDPIRLLRAFRLSGTLEFGIEDRTLDIITIRSASLRRSAKERIRDEIFRILSLQKSSSYLRQMNDTGLLKEIFSGLNANALIEGLVILDRLEQLYDSLGEIFPVSYIDVEKYLNSRIEEGITKAVLLKWLCFYFNNNVTEELMMSALLSLRLGNRASKLAVLGVEYCGVRNGGGFILDRNVRDKDINNKKEIYKFFKSTEDDGIGLILYQIAALKQFRDISDVPVRNAREAISWYLDDLRRIRRNNKLISGNDIKEHFHLTPGPVFKQLLDIIEENMALGVLSTKDDALDFIRKLAQTSNLI